MIMRIPILKAILAKEKARDYEAEYREYHGKPEQIKRRAQRNAARRKLGLKRGDPREADHKNPLSNGGSNSKRNLRAVSRETNRRKGSSVGKAWEEQKHPRADDGKFTSGSTQAGGSSSTPTPKTRGSRAKPQGAKKPSGAKDAIHRVLTEGSALDRLAEPPKLTPDQMKTVRAYRKKIKSDHRAIVKELKSVFGKEHEIEARVKKPESIAEKLGRKPEKYGGDPANLQDISGMRIVAKSQASLESAVREFKARYGDKIIEGTEDNFYEHPQDPDPGYRAYHATIERNGMPHEVQIKTKNMGIWSECNHPLYKNDSWTEGAGRDPEIRAYMKACAEVYQRRDRGEKANLPETPKRLDALEGWHDITRKFGWG